MEIEIKNLTKIYNKQTVLNINELSINKGELVGLIGNNGAGKTTLLRLLTDLIKADSGTVISRGKKVNKTEDWKFYTSAYIDSGFLIEFLTPEEYFNFIASNYKISNYEVKRLLDKFADFMNGEIIGKRKYIRDFSTGNQQKIGIIGAIISNPEILFLDEPFNFLDPTSQIIMKRLLQEYNRKYGTTVLLSSHNLQYVMDICNRIIVLDSGKIRYDETKPSDTVKLEIEKYFENRDENYL
jgi:ABC-2 type transport system ATP-binding protein